MATVIFFEVEQSTLKDLCFEGIRFPAPLRDPGRATLRLKMLFNYSEMLIRSWRPAARSAEMTLSGASESPDSESHCAPIEASLRLFSTVVSMPFVVGYVLTWPLLSRPDRNSGK